MSKKYLFAIASCLLGAFTPFAQGVTLSDSTGVNIALHGYMGFETEEIVSGRYAPPTPDFNIDHRWGGNTIGQLTANVQFSQRSRMLLTLEGRWWLGNYPSDIAGSADAYQGLQNYSSFDVWQAQGIYTINKDPISTLELSFGIIPYKYNPEARNLGEYLFRSLCYPGILFNNFDFPLDQLSGVRLNYRQHIGGNDFTNGNFSADAFVLSEREVRPFGDISLAAVLDYKTKPFDFGIGTELYRIFSVNSNLTTPKGGNATLYGVSNTVTDSAGNIIHQDSSFYSFAGAKLMAHITLDPLFFLRDSPAGKILGKEGGKIYAEADILGLKNYPRNDSLVEAGGVVSHGLNPYGYDTLMNKMPITFGINIPVPYVDVCALEFEYYRCRYPDNYSEVFVNARPLPENYVTSYTIAGIPDNTYSTLDNWKWSLYIKKNISRNFHIVFQAARDHQRWSIPAFVWDKYSDWEDISVLPKNWMWNLKAEVVF